jgi:hypothetical protein
MSETVIRMILGWTMMELGRNHSVHSIGEIKAPHALGGVVPDGEESRTLASLRETLLPKLMRGEVRVKDV